MATVSTPSASVPRTPLQVAGGWPLARRAGIGPVRFGGRTMTRRMLEGAAVGEGARVVDLAPGNGATGALLNDVNLHSYTAVCLNPDQAAQVHARVAGLERREVVATPDRTGLDDGEATAVIAEGLLTGLSAPGKHAVLRETLRILRPGGHAAFHELCLEENPWDRGAQPLYDTFAAPAGGGLRPLGEAGWRQVARTAGLEVAGFTRGPFDPPDLGELLRDAGVREAPRLAARLLLPGRVAPRWRAVSYLFDTHAASLSGAVLVVRRPVLARV